MGGLIFGKRKSMVEISSPEEERDLSGYK